MDAATRVLQSQHFILGCEVEALERDSRLCWVRFAIGCASGSDALLLSLMALESVTAMKLSLPPLLSLPLQVRLRDFGPAASVRRHRPKITYNMDENQLKRAITPQDAAIMPVHLFGLPAQMDSILGLARVHKLDVIEDAAQVNRGAIPGAAVGSLGRARMF